MAEPPNSLLARQALQLLESLQGAGVQQLPKPGPIRRSVEKPAAEPTVQGTLAQDPEPLPPVASPSLPKQTAAKAGTLF